VDVNPDIAEAMGLNFTRGALVVRVIAGSPAASADIRAGTHTVDIGGGKITLGGDIIVGVDAANVRKFIDLIVYIERNKNPGDTVILKIIREGKPLNAEVTLGTRPPP
jgi:S1-C subfamily serine protease